MDSQSSDGKSDTIVDGEGDSSNTASFAFKNPEEEKGMKNEQ